MKKIVLPLLVVAIVVALPFIHTATAGNTSRVQICHRTGVISDGLPDGNCVLPNGTAIAEGDQCGIRITVNEHALAAHENHGDRMINSNRPDGTTCSLVGGGGGGS